jgi:hypothetical protein
MLYRSDRIDRSSLDSNRDQRSIGAIFFVNSQHKPEFFLSSESYEEGKMKQLTNRNKVNLLKTIGWGLIIASIISTIIGTDVESHLPGWLSLVIIIVSGAAFIAGFWLVFIGEHVAETHGL